MLQLLRIRPEDNVGVQMTDGGPVKRGHKVAVQAIAAGQPIVKYGFVIGIANRDIAEGEHVHTHNVRAPTDAELGNARPKTQAAQGSVASTLPTTFQGYRRPAGRAGTRNVIVVMATVNCSATVSKAIAARFTGRDLSSKGLDRVVAVTHTMGCAQAIGGSGYQVLNRTLAGTLFHPNVVGGVIVGLGCEQTTLKSILAARDQDGRVRDVPLKHFGIQEVGGTAEAIARGVAEVEAMIAELPTFTREALPVGELCLAMNCGGSDAFSGLTANPVLGRVADLLAAAGAPSGLAEIPECHGAEGLLLDRCTRPEDRKKLGELFTWWNDHLKGHDSEFNNNLALGNIEGGLTTIVEKSLGAVAKGGLGPVEEVVEYAAPIHRGGLVLMNTPGFDPVSVTGLVAGGSNLVAFTTGRGSTFGSGVAPTLKLTTTTELYERMRGDMDFDVGTVLKGERIEDAAERLFRKLVAVASGERTKSELLGMGTEEFVPWSVGATL